jgi:hypothetical protein
MLWSLLLLFCSVNLHAQEKTTKYNILQNGNIIGQMQLYKKNSGDDLYLKMTSHAKTRFFIDILVDTEESSHFNNGKLVNSVTIRHVNGKQKASKQTQFIDNLYQIRSDDKISRLNAAINYNLMLLYINEPTAVSRVYSDNYQQFLEVRQIRPHSYRVTLPDGNYNDYDFSNGICREVTVHHSLYTINIRLA